MKRTDLERRERELKRSIKQDTVIERKSSRGEKTIGMYIEDLFSLFRYDEQNIFNTTDDIEILEILEEIKESQPEKQWDNIVRKAIRKTKISNKEKAYDEIFSLLS